MLSIRIVYEARNYNRREERIRTTGCPEDRGGLTGPRKA